MRRTLLFFQESDIKWASRWDTYLTMSDVQIHWFSIINSVVVVFFLSGEWMCGERKALLLSAGNFL